MGLVYQSETKLDYAEYFKIYHYDQGITLLEIDMTKGTANDPEKLAAEAINAENETGESEDVAKDTECRSEYRFQGCKIRECSRRRYSCCRNFGGWRRKSEWYK